MSVMILNEIIHKFFKSQLNHCIIIVITIIQKKKEKKTK